MLVHNASRGTSYIIHAADTEEERTLKQGTRLGITAGFPTFF